MRIIVGKDAGELATAADAPCDIPLPPGAPNGVRCPFRKGHKCACRYLGTVQMGSFGGSNA